jgi:hypothetical protein
VKRKFGMACDCHARLVLSVDKQDGSIGPILRSLDLRPGDRVEIIVLIKREEEALEPQPLKVDGVEYPNRGAL